MKFIIIVFTIYLIYRFLSNVFAPARQIKPQARPVHDMGGPRPREGQVNIKDIPGTRDAHHQHRNTGEAEYIDYKEL